MEQIEYKFDYSEEKVLIDGINCPECNYEIVLKVDGETWLEYHITKLTFIDKSKKKGSDNQK